MDPLIEKLEETNSRERSSVLQFLTMAENQQAPPKDPNKALAESIMTKIKPLPSSRCSIFRVPKRFRTVKEEAYVPEIVSIGPLHKGRPNLQPMEEQKRWYLHALLSRSTTPETTPATLEGMVKSIRDIETYCRASYAEPTGEKFSSDEFVEMMLLDGCFLLELLHRDVEESSRKNNNNNTDPIFGIAWMIFCIQNDLILLENQIPFVVLERLFSLTNNDPELGCRSSLNELVLCFFAAMLPATQNRTTEHEYENTTTQGEVVPKHVLDLLRSQLLPYQQETEEDATHSPFWESTHCATDLTEIAGVTFKRREAADGLLDIKFTDGVFEIPPFFFDESTDVLLRNLVAMEQCERNSRPMVTSYVLLLDILIKSKKDVELLCRHNIIRNFLADDEEMAAVIYSICKGVSINEFCYDMVCNEANDYFKQDCNRWKAKLKSDYETLKRDYFNTPWAVLSVIAAVILLILTLIQTLFAGLSYTPPFNANSH